ncbi:MAG: AAA family ATPase [Sphaerochaetaceae bacterium]
MFLKSLELYGFKSFADKTRLEFGEGITSLLGPNGCGKSNVVDAIKWVLGEQSTKTLRAGKMEDVIFNGTENRQALNVAEVSLVIGNEGRLLPIDHSEVEIRRRLFRSGESEFYINRNLVRLRDVRELFWDTGIGKSAYSILEQGKIDQILSTRPEDRRYIFEEAAGITRYKQRSLEAGRKLERTEENIEQVETLLGEIKRQYDLRKSQASKLVRYRELEKELTEIEVLLQLSTIQSYTQLRQKREADLETAKADFEALKSEIERRSRELEEEQELVRTREDERYMVQGDLHRLEEQANSKAEQLNLLQERYRDFVQNKADYDERARQILERLKRDELLLNDYYANKEEIEEQIEVIKVDIDKNTLQMGETQNSIKSNEEQVEEHEKAIIGEEQLQQELSQTLQSLVDRLVSELDERLKDYSSVQRESAEKELTESLAQFSQKLAMQRPYGEAAPEYSKLFVELQEGLANLKRSFERYKATLPSFIDEFIAPEGIITQKHTIDNALKLSREKLNYHRQRILALKEDREELLVLLEQYREYSTQSRVALGESSERLTSIKGAIESLEKSSMEQKHLYEDLLKDGEVAQERLSETSNLIEEIKGEQTEIKAKRERLDADLGEIVRLIGVENERLAGERHLMNERHNRLSEMRSTIDKYTYHIESLNGQIEQVYITFFDTYGKSLKEYDERLDSPLGDAKALKEELSLIKKQIQQMGYINHMAEQEFGEVKERYDFLNHQMSDLEKARRDLFKVIEEIKRRSEKLFMETYQKIRVSFQEMFHRMFGGGRADLRLLDAENVLDSGIDILAQPPGKKLDTLAPLSGGEKSLTAVALLFATYKVKPSPFCVLDEIDAALDDRNIGFFLNVLEDFSLDSQFVIITHNKRTVLGSDTLLGVTMQEKGISKAISYRKGLAEEPLVDTALGNTV